MLDDLRSLAIFAAVGRAGSFRAAATALGLSPQVVSHHISALETRRGVALIHRSTRALRLTPDGERLLAFAARMADAATDGLQELSASRDEPAGALRVALSTLFRHAPYIDWVADFAAAHPKINLSLGFSEDRRDLIRDGYDLAIRIGRIDPANFKIRKLLEIERTTVATPAFIAAQPPAATPADLGGWDWVMLKTVSSRQTFVGETGEETAIETRGRVAVDNAEAMTALVLAGLGVASAPRHFVTEELADGRLVQVLPQWRPPPLSAYALWPMNAPPRSLAARFIEHIADQARTRSLPGS